MCETAQIQMPLALNTTDGQRDNKVKSGQKFPAMSYILTLPKCEHLFYLHSRFGHG